MNRPREELELIYNPEGVAYGSCPVRELALVTPVFGSGQRPGMDPVRELALVTTVTGRSAQTSVTWGIAGSPGMPVRPRPAHPDGDPDGHNPGEARRSDAPRAPEQGQKHTHTLPSEINEMK